MQDIPIAELDRLPILQYVVTFLVAMTWVIGVTHALRTKDKSQSHQSQHGTGKWHEQLWFFDGPVKSAMDSIARMERAVVDMRNAVEGMAANVDNAMRDFAHRHEEQGNTLKDVKGSIDLLRETLRGNLRR